MTARHTADLTLRRRESELSRTIVPAASVLAAALVLAVALPPASHAATSGKLQPATTVPATGSVPRRADDRWWLPSGFRPLNRLLEHRSYPTMAWP